MTMMGRSCELCKSPARISCEADQAKLCWGCDAAVHGANFLVARHSRSLLCRRCQSPTPWSASGARLSPTAFSLCEMCVSDGEKVARTEGGGENEIGDEQVEIGDEDENDDDVEEEEENHVVRGRSMMTPPPPATSSSSSEVTSSPSDEESDAQTPSIMKRRRDEGGSDLLFQENHRRPKCRRSVAAPVHHGTGSIMPEVDAGGRGGGGGGGGDSG